MSTPKRPKNIPSDITPAELWVKMTETPRPVTIVDFPRMVNDQTVQVAIRVLTQDEQMRCVMAAQTFARKELEKNKIVFDMSVDVVRQIVEYHNTIEVVFEVCRSPENYEVKFFRSREEIRKFLSADEVGVLAMEWLRFTSEVSPLMTEMSNAEMQALIEFIAAEGASLPLARLTPKATIRLLNFMASLLCKSPQDSDSPGLPLESTPSESESDENT